MSAQIRGLNQSVRNANDTISLIQVAEGALSETTAALQRIRELAVQSANDTNVSSDRADMQKEVDQLILEIDRIANTTQFNGQTLLSGGFANKVFHVGAYTTQTIAFTITGATATDLTVNATTVDTQANAETAIATLDTAINSVTTVRANLGAYQNRFESVIANLSNVSLNTSGARSRITDADMAAETAKLTQNSILQQAGSAILAQANQQPSIILQMLK